MGGRFESCVAHHPTFNTFLKRWDVVPSNRRQCSWFARGGIRSLSTSGMRKKTGVSLTKKLNIGDLKKQARQYRIEILTALQAAGSGHPGGSLSAVEILLSLYGYKMNHKPKDPKWENRDRLIVSKGHISLGVYVVLADCGYFPKEELQTFRKRSEERRVGK